MDISLSLGTSFPKMIFFIAGHEILMEGSMSEIFDLGLSFYFMLKNG